MKWEKVKLGDLYLVDSRNGLTKPSRVRGSGYKMINMGELFSHDRIYDIPMELVPLSEREKLTSKVEEGDLLFARQSLVFEGAGKCSIVMATSPLTVFESHLIRVRLNQENAYPLFYYYYFKSPQSPVKTIVSQCAQSGIRGSELSELQIPLPPLSVQKRIADILSAYDDLIENNQKQIKLLEEAAQRLYKEWFVDFRFPGHESTPIIDGIPQGWKKGAVNSLVSLLSGYSFKSSEFTEDGLYKLVTIKNVKDGEFDGEKVCFIKELPQKMPSHCILKDGDILLSLTGNIGRVCIVHGKHYLLNQRVAKFKTEFPAYAYFLFRSDDMVATLNNLANGVAQQNLSPIRTENLNIHIPSQGVLMSFERNVYPMLNRIVTLNKQITSLREARDRLLPKLMSGEIDVSEVEV